MTWRLVDCSWHSTLHEHGCTHTYMQADASRVCCWKACNMLSCLHACQHTMHHVWGLAVASSCRLMTELGWPPLFVSQSRVCAQRHAHMFSVQFFALLVSLTTLNCASSHQARCMQLLMLVCSAQCLSVWICCLSAQPASAGWEAQVA